MYLKRLEIQGFKSFSQATVLSFEPGITVIVGPNGSGKSNIVDAIRWVLGEQSKTLLRGKKAEDVIFVGSTIKARARLASVALVFDNQDGKLPVDSAEVVFSRRLDREGNSEYLINNQPARLMDISEALLNAGFIQSRYTVIGQGTIDQFLLQGPSEIKTLIEEGAGLAALYSKKDKTLRRLEATRSNLEQIRALIAEIEPRLRTLRRQAKKVEARTQIEREWRNLFSGRLAAIFRNLQVENEKFVKDINNLQSNIAKIDQEVESYYKNLEKNNDGSSNIGKQIAKLQENLTFEQQQKEKLQIRLAEMKSGPEFQLKHTDASVLAVKISELETEERELFNQANELTANITEAENDIKEIAEILDQAKADLVPRFNAIADRFIAGQRQFLNKLKAQLRDVEKSLTRRRQDLQAVTDATGSDISKDLIQTTNEELSSQQDRIRIIEEKIKEKLDGISQYTSERSRADREMRKKELELNKLRSDQNEVRIALARAEARLEEEERRAQSQLGGDFKKIINSAQPIDDAVSDERIEYLKKQLEIIGGLDELTMQEYEETESRYSYLTTQVKDLEKADIDLTHILHELDSVIKQRFNQSYDLTNEKFGQYFRLLFNGGKANLIKIKNQKLPLKPDQDSEEETIHEEIEEEFPERSDEIVGIEVRATPPGKKLSSIAALSGGERTLTSIALLMALLESNPSPFVVLDEVDAALDESNSIRFAKILEGLAGKTQFITITHNRETMKRAHTLYGVTMGENGVSQVLSIKFDASLAYAQK